MAVNTTVEEKDIAAKIAANCQPLADALNRAGFSTKLTSYAARFDRGCGARIIVSSPKREYWAGHLVITAHWNTGMPVKVTSRVRGERTLTLAAKNIEKIVARVQADLDADIADEKRRRDAQSNAQSWFDQACADFSDYELPPGLKSERGSRHRFERLNRGMSSQTPGTYSLNLDDREVLANLRAAQVKALGEFLKKLPTIC